MTNLTPSDIDSVCGLVDDLCGISWDESKAYLIEARLASIVASSGCANYADLVNKVRADIVPGLQEQVVDAVTTNETLWFRDSTPFDAMRFKVLPDVIDEKANSVFPRRLRIWSAACSTGQESYSLGIAIAETIPNVDSWDIQIVGTDISSAAVTKASRGIYSKLEIGRGLDFSNLQKHFVECDGGWQIHDRIRAMCSFATRNLHAPFTDLGMFDVVFCRNVAIYFTPEDRRSIFERMADSLAPYGWVFVGSSESLNDLGERWRPQQHCRSNCYRPNQPDVTQQA